MRHNKSVALLVMLAMALLAGCATSRGYGKGWTVEANGTRVMAGTVESVVRIPHNQATTMRQKVENGITEQVEGTGTSELIAHAGSAFAGPLSAVLGLYDVYKVFKGPKEPLLSIRTANGMMRYPVMASSYPKGATVPTFTAGEKVTVEYRKSWKYPRVYPVTAAVASTATH